MIKILFILLNLFLLNVIFFSGNSYAFKVNEVKSEKGIKAYLLEDNSNQIISLSFQFSLGAIHDPKEKLGLSRMVARLLDEGAGSFNSFEFQSELANYGIRLSFNNSRDTFSGSLTTVSANLDKAMNLLSLALISPRFDKEPLERVRRQIKASITREEDRPSSYAQKKLYSLIYPNHPYGNSLNGSVDTIDKISRRDLKLYIKKRFSRNNLIVGAAGNINEKTLKIYLDRVFGRLPTNSDLNTKLIDVVPKSFGTLVVEKNFPQSVIIASSPGISRNNVEWYSALLANHILGGGSFTSRLMTEIREKRGLAYSVGSSLVSYKFSNMIYTSLGTRNEAVGESVEVLKGEWRKFQLRGINAQELQLAKDYITGSWPLSFTSSQGIASLLVVIQYYKLGLNYISERDRIIDSVSIEQVNSIARRLFNVNNLSFLIVGMPKGLASVDE